MAPHQQPTDICDGESYGGCGGWSWYTGSAARMLSAAYAILGLPMEGGEVVLPDNLHIPRGYLRIRRITVKGQVRAAPEEAGADRDQMDPPDRVKILVQTETWS